MALWSDGERCHGVLTDAGPIAAAATVLATGGAAALWRRTTNPRGAIGAGPVMAAAAGADLADLEFCQFHPTALALPGTRFDGMLITEAVRGEGATLLDAAGRRFTDELAPRDAVTAAILDRIAADGRRACELDLRERRPGPLPQRLRVARRGRPRPALRAGAGRARRPLHDGRDRGGPRRPLLAARPLRGRRVLLHRPARRQPARLELAQRVLRLRRPRRRARRWRRAAPRGARPRSRSWRFEPPTEATRDAVWRLAGPLRQPDELASLRDDPYPLAGGDRDLRPGAARVARRPPAHRLPRARPRARRRPPRARRDGEIRRERRCRPALRPAGTRGSVGPCCSGSTSAGPSPTPSSSTASALHTAKVPTTPGGPVAGGDRRGRGGAATAPAPSPATSRPSPTG